MIFSIHQNPSDSVKLAPRQKRAIPLVVAARNIEEGCRSAAISTQTWYTWMKDKGFKEEVDRQRELVISDALDRLKGSVRGAVEGLRTLLDAEEKNIRLRACAEVLDYFLKARELEDIERRLSKLEEAARAE